ncbi:MAG TPA: hypothetical protein VF661_12085 [Actinomycetales bacterium]|jgi:hypothetical protein
MRKPVPAVLFGLLACLVLQAVVGAGMASSGGSRWVGDVGALLTAVVGPVVAALVLSRARSNLRRFVVVAGAPALVLMVLILVVQVGAGAGLTELAPTVALWAVGGAVGGLLAWRLSAPALQDDYDAYPMR